MKNNLRALLFSLLSFGFIYETAGAAETARTVEIKNNQLMIDGSAQPQLFGAEVQYFRLRGGYGKNIPRAKVIALWNKALDRFVEAKMNAISFYIPWDFHEYAEGKFDFTGEADEDKDGNPDYPSRDLVTFFRLIEEHGIRRIMVRPGPYINAEWGFLGFGAVPEWFHHKYPDSHMKTSFGWKTKLYDYLNPDLLRHSKLWFQALHENVLKYHLGFGKPIVFLQLDNETNYQWQSIYNHDYGPRSVRRYQQFLKDTYHEMSDLNLAHNRQWMHWTQIQPPLRPGQNLKEDQDWYRFSDQSIFLFLGEIRNIWEDLQVREPQVLFTLAESYNAPADGLIPHYIYRNAKDVTGLMTVNLYPKTYETPKSPLLNSPFKTDLDVKSADEANDSYFGSKQEWVMGPEIQGGWWRGVPVSWESRQQTYLTVLGHGMKALFIYYFNEGQNWETDWSFNQIKPIFEQLRKERKVESLPIAQLSNEFWGELQARADRNILIGFDARKLMTSNSQHDEELYFDAPIDGNAEARPHFDQLKKIGERIIAPYQDFLSRGLEIHDHVAFVKDSASHAPGPLVGIFGIQAATDWSGGLLGYLMNSSLNPRVLMGDMSPESAFSESKVLVHLDSGVHSPRTEILLKQASNRGQTIINYLGDSMAQALGFQLDAVQVMSAKADDIKLLTFFIGPHGEFRSGTEPDAKALQIKATGPLFKYSLKSTPNAGFGICQAFLYWQGEVVGYRCKTAKGSYVQIGSAFFKDYNSDDYGQISDFSERKVLMQALMNEAGVNSQLQLSEKAARTVAFGRKDPLKELLWITLKTGTETAQTFHLKVSADLLASNLKLTMAARVRNCDYILKVTDLLAAHTQSISACDLSQKGVQIQLPANGSSVITIKN